MVVVHCRLHDHPGRGRRQHGVSDRNKVRIMIGEMDDRTPLFFRSDRFFEILSLQCKAQGWKQLEIAKIPSFFRRLSLSFLHLFAAGSESDSSPMTQPFARETHALVQHGFVF